MINTSQVEIEISDERQSSCDTKRNLNQIENYNIKFERRNLLEESKNMAAKSNLNQTIKPGEEDSDEFNIDIESLDFANKDQERYENSQEYFSGLRIEEQRNISLLVKQLGKKDRVIRSSSPIKLLR